MSSTCFVIKCSKWNQGCFDAAFVYEGQLVTTNFTISVLHSLKVGYIHLLKMALERAKMDIKLVTHLAIVPDKEICNSFSFDTPDDVGYNNGKPLFELKLACGTKFKKPSLVPELKLVSSSNTPDGNIVVMSTLGANLVLLWSSQMGKACRRDTNKNYWIYRYGVQLDWLDPFKSSFHL